MQLALAGDEKTANMKRCRRGGMMKGWFPTRKSEKLAYIYIYLYFIHFFGWE